MQFITIASALLAAAPVAQAAGNAIVHNKCGHDVYLWSVTADYAPSKPVVLAAGTGSYNEAYQVPSQGGVSIKLSNTTTVDGPITQFEYTLSGDIWYDLSNVNCKTTECPFQSTGMYLMSGTGCPTVSCPGGELTCSGAYTNPDDNWASLACAATADTVVYLCQDTSDGSSSQASSVASVAPTTTPSTIGAPSTAAATTLATTTKASATTEAATTTTTAKGWKSTHTHAARAAHAPRHPHARPQ